MLDSILYRGHEPFEMLSQHAQTPRIKHEPPPLIRRGRARIARSRSGGPGMAAAPGRWRMRMRRLLAESNGRMLAQDLDLRAR